MSDPVKQRERRERIAQEQGKTLPPYRPHGGRSDAERRERKLERQRAYRMRNAQRDGRNINPRGTKSKYDAHVALWELLHRNEGRIGRRRARLHDAHVVRYRAVMRDRSRGVEYSRKLYQQNPDRERARQSEMKARLCDHYVKQQLRSMGIESQYITEAMVSIKREQILLRRCSRQLKRAATNQEK